MPSKRKTKNQLSETAELLKYSVIGAFAGIICCIVFSLLAALIVSKSSLPQSSILPISYVVIAISMLIGGFISGRLFHRQALVVGLITALISFALIFLSEFFLPDIEEEGNTIIKFACCFIPSIVGAVVGANMHRKY